MQALTFRARLFAAFYLGKARGNATEAARLAGYACPKAEGSRLLRDPLVAALIDARIESAAMECEEILSRLTDMAGADLSDLAGVFVDETAPVLDGEGRPVKGEDGQVATAPTGRRIVDWDKLKASGLGHLVRKITPTRHGDALELHDAMVALTMLGKFRRLFAESIEFRPRFDVKELSTEHLKALLAGRDPRSLGIVG
jgi:phage terminase small subunit